MMKMGNMFGRKKKSAMRAEKFVKDVRLSKKARFMKESCLQQKMQSLRMRDFWMK